MSNDFHEKNIPNQRQIQRNEAAAKASDQHHAATPLDQIPVARVLKTVYQEIKCPRRRREQGDQNAAGWIDDEHHGLAAASDCITRRTQAADRHPCDG